ncbi:MULTISPECIES: cell wall metabolism sensor histidine kinase WalK [Kocuria]|uniref:histidine kinase n=2 Tax=Kocuria TaxID=57493 RepID=A0ABV9TQE0_9MICC|nr:MULTISPECIES: ATP-binding protein [Kocuria]KLU08388.1 histidine kinase [Kocuria sp. SM24M-10]OLT12347.1 two-component sensor histidine kinase [Kocuria sp. CNJ-770]WJZ68518.1 ATP-binding protein [Kocuria rosea]
MSTTTSTGRRWSWSPLTVRLMLAQTAVLAVGLIIVVVTAVLIGPNMFYHELVQAGHADAATGLVHLQDAFRSVSLTALVIGGLPALYIAGLLTFYLYRTIGRSLASFSTAAGEVAAGNYEVRVTSAKLGPEFDSLASSFNEMAARLDAVDTTRRQMLADLAHEMRTPLASLKGHLEGIEDGVVELDGHTTGILNAQITRLERLARDIRQLTAAEEGMTRMQLTPQDPQHLADQAVAAIEPDAAGKGVSITSLSTGMDVTPIPLDPERMGQVLSNLLENALRHTPPGGTITLHTDHAPEAVTYTVTDSGEGISSESLPHVFERFYRANTGREAHRGGSGLGLAISKTLIEAQGGTLEATSAGPGRGASFRIHLPRHRPNG